MRSARADKFQRNTIASTAFIVPLVCFFCVLMLAGCKKDSEQSEAGDVSSPASVLSAPDEISAAEEQASRPSGEMKGLSVHTIPSVENSPVMAITDMKPVSGMDMSVRMSPRMVKTPGWTKDFPALYKPLNDCLEQIDGGAAYAANINDDQEHIIVQVVGLDGHWQECRMPHTGGQALTIKPIEEQPQTGPAFFPHSAGKPLTNNPQCYSMEAIVARPGGLIGWLAYTIPDCQLTVNP